MSIPSKTIVTCPKCGTPVPATIFESVNSEYADNIAMQIISGELFDIQCPHCKFVTHLEYDVLYHDMNHGAMIWVVHKNSPNYIKKITEIRTSPKLPYNTLRIVNDMNALREKVSCLEYDRDDRIIELCKVGLAGALIDQAPSFDFKSAFYSAFNGKELVYFYNLDGDSTNCDLPEEIYDDLKERFYGSCYSAQFDNNYPIIDFDWAKRILGLLLEIDDSSSNKNNDLPLNDDGHINSEENDNDSKKLEQEMLQLVQQCTQKEVEQKRFENEQKKIARKQKREKKEKIKDKLKLIVKYILLSVVIGLIVSVFINAIIEKNQPIIEHNIATEEISVGLTNVYADVVTFEPQYIVTESIQKLEYDVSEIENVVCWCTTIEGKEFWISIPVDKYTEDVEGLNKNISPSFNKKHFKTPLRVNGWIATFDDIADNAPEELKDTLVLKGTVSASD